jgi:hypothetical protein
MPVRFKARLVAQGFAQKYGLDHRETFAPTLRYESLRTLLAVVAVHDLHLNQMDIVAAYSEGDVEEELYMRVPECIDMPEKVCRLRKGLYGLKQAGRNWHRVPRSTLTNAGFEATSADLSMFYHQAKRIVIALYIDDLRLAGPVINDTIWAKGQLQLRHQAKDLGEAAICLGKQIKRDCSK